MDNVQKCDSYIFTEVWPFDSFDHGVFIRNPCNTEQTKHCISRFQLETEWSVYGRGDISAIKQSGSFEEFCSLNPGSVN
jgi:hypothetical protein